MLGCPFSFVNDIIIIIIIIIIITIITTITFFVCLE